MNETKLNPDWLTMDKTVDGTLIMTKMDVESPYVVLDKNETALYKYLWDKKHTNDKSILPEHLQSETELAIHTNLLINMLAQKGIVIRHANPSWVYQLKNGWETKEVEEGLKINETAGTENQFLIEGHMAEMFRKLTHNTQTLEQLIQHEMNEFEESDHAELRLHIQGFFNDLLSQGLIAHVG